MVLQPTKVEAAGLLAKPESERACLASPETGKVSCVKSTSAVTPFIGTEVLNPLLLRTNSKLPELSRRLRANLNFCQLCPFIALIDP